MHQIIHLSPVGCFTPARGKTVQKNPEVTGLNSVMPYVYVNSVMTYVYVNSVMPYVFVNSVMPHINVNSVMPYIYVK